MGKVSALDKFLAKAGKTLKSGAKKAGDAVMDAATKNPGAVAAGVGGTAAGAGAAVALGDDDKKFKAPKKMARGGDGRFTKSEGYC